MFYLEFVSASSDHIKWIQDTLYRLLGVHGHVTTSKRSCIVQLKYAKTEGLKILKSLYPSSKVVCLKRKRLKIERALRIVGESLSD